MRMRNPALLIGLAAVLGLVGSTIAEESENKSPLNPELTAQEIGDKFVNWLRELDQLTVESFQAVRVWRENSAGEVIPGSEKEVVLKATFYTTRSSFNIDVRYQHTLKPVYALTFTDGWYTEQHWHEEGVKTKTSPADCRLDGVTLMRFWQNMGFWDNLGEESPCATWEFTGTWLGGSTVGEGKSLPSSAKRQSSDLLTDDGWMYQIAGRTHRYWYDENFRRVREKSLTARQRMDGTISYHEVDARYQYLVVNGE